jgi:hypothetical protein
MGVDGKCKEMKYIEIDTSKFAGTPMPHVSTPHPDMAIIFS